MFGNDELANAAEITRNSNPAPIDNSEYRLVKRRERRVPTLPELQRHGLGRNTR
jgi:hypothetical protein